MEHPPIPPQADDCGFFSTLDLWRQLAESHCCELISPRSYRRPVPARRRAARYRQQQRQLKALALTIPEIAPLTPNLTHRSGQLVFALLLFLSRLFVIELVGLEERLRILWSRGGLHECANAARVKIIRINTPAA